MPFTQETHYLAEKLIANKAHEIFKILNDKTDPKFSQALLFAVTRRLNIMCNSVAKDSDIENVTQEFMDDGKTWKVTFDITYKENVKHGLEFGE